MRTLKHLLYMTISGLLICSCTEQLNFGQDVPQGEWVSFGKGTLVDDAVSPLLGLPLEILEVEVQESKNQKGLYRFVDPYKGASFYGQYASGIPGEIVIETKDSTSLVLLHESHLGMKKENQEFLLFPKKDCYGEMDWKNKTVRFQKRGLNVKFRPDVDYPANMNGYFMLVLPGGKIPPFDKFSINNMYSYPDSEGVDQINVDLFLDMNYKKEVFYKFYDTTVDVNTEYQKFLDGELQMTKLQNLKAGMKNIIKHKPQKSGVYTVLVVGQDSSGAFFADNRKCEYKKEGENPDPVEPELNIAFNYFEVPQTLKEKEEYKYILHSGETYTSRQKVRNYSACYDTRRHNPMWVAYPCHNIWWEGGYGRPVTDPWRPDPKMSESEQSVIYAKDWRDWPWSSNNGRPVDNDHYWSPVGQSYYFTKGHLMRSAERGTRDKSNLFKMNEQTFYPTNISPERYPTVKNKDGKKVTHWALVEGIMPNDWRCSDTLYVVTGCYYENDSFIAKDASNNGYGTYRTKDCVVPAARWKVFLRTKSGNTGKPVSECRADELMAIAFWFPQALGYSNMVKELPPLSEYTLSVNALEAKIGGEFNFFPQVPDEVCNSFNVSDWPALSTIFNAKIDSNYTGPYIYY